MSQTVRVHRPRPVLAFAIAALALLPIVGCAGGDSEPAAEESSTDEALATDDEKMLYAIGAAMANQLVGFDLDEADLAVIQTGLSDSVNGEELAIELEEWGPRIPELLQARQARRSEKEKVRGDAFRADQEQQEGATKLDSGMIYFEIAAGDGASPGPNDTVTIEYEGKFVDDEVFDSSKRAGEPGVLTLNQVVPCFSEGMQRMKVGGKAKLVCPPELAYGDQGYGAMIPPGASLVFEVELLDVQPAAN